MTGRLVDVRLSVAWDLVLYAEITTVLDPNNDADSLVTRPLPVKITVSRDRDQITTIDVVELDGDGDELSLDLPDAQVGQLLRDLATAANVDIIRQTAAARRARAPLTPQEPADGTR